MSSMLDQLAVSLGRNDEAPNVTLAQTVAAGKDTEAIAELISLLDNRNQAIRSDALKVLYEAGKIEPSLIAPYVDRFAQLLTDRSNRMVWGGMEALASIAGVAPQLLLPHLEAVMHATETGNVASIASTTVVAGGRSYRPLVDCSGRAPEPTSISLPLFQRPV